MVRAKTIMLTVMVCAAVVRSNAESLVETGGYVPSGDAVLAFGGIGLGDLGTRYLPSAKMSGGFVTSKDGAVSFCVRTVTENAVTYQTQYMDGSFVKCVFIEFTEGDDGVYARATQARYTSTLADYGKDMSSGNAGYVATSDSASGYGIHNLGLVPATELDSINLNFLNSASATLSGNVEVGAPGYEVVGGAWSQMLGTNNNILNGVNAVASGDGGAFFGELTDASVTVSGTRGTWSTSSYTSSSDVRFGYIDENSDNATPTVTVTGVPFDFYRVVFIPSTDTSNNRFGYITVNGESYSSDNSEMATDKDYSVVAGSTASWGKTQVADYLHGVNYLVTPVIYNPGGVVEVVGHKVSGARGCIAAIQIARVAVPAFTEREITASQINEVCTAGEETFLKVPDGAVVTLDVELAASKVKFASAGSISFVAEAMPSAEELAKIDVSYVGGAVLRSWLTPGVVGFIFNANGGWNSNTNVFDGAADTSIALETGDWFKDPYSPTGSSVEMFADGLSTLSWKSKNVWVEATSLEDGTFIQGYLDDGNDGPVITMTGVPYDTYDIIIYCSTDESSKGFKAKAINGTIYTWENGGAVETTDVNASWGLSSAAAGKAVYGANTLRVNGLSGALSIKGGDGQNGARGCISAIQIMPAGTSTAPEMTVGTAGVETLASWSDPANWNGRVPSTGTVIINVEGDVTLTIDEDIAMSAVTVRGEGSLKLVRAEGVSASMDSLSSMVEIIFTDDTIAIDALSAPTTYQYKTDSIVSSIYGNTYTQGIGDADAEVSISHNGGYVTLTGETYYLSNSANAIHTEVTFRNAKAVYSGQISVGTAMYIVEGNSEITARRLVLSDLASGRTANMVVKDDAVVTLTGGADGDTNQGSMFGHWNGPSTFTLQGNAKFTSAAYEIIVGRTRNNHTINIEGGTFTAKGIKASAYATGTNVLNLKGGTLALGSLGIGSYGSSTRIKVNVTGTSALVALSDTLPITQSVDLGAGSVLSMSKGEGVESATVTLSGGISGEGDISIGAGITLDIGTDRPEGMISFAEDSGLALRMTDKADVPVLRVSSAPSFVRLYDIDGNEISSSFEHNATENTLTINTQTPIWSHKVDYSFDNAANWSHGALPTAGQDCVILADEDAEITVSGTYVLGDLAVVGAGNVTISGDRTNIEAASYDFSKATGHVEYCLPTSDKTVIVGSDTVLKRNGSGELDISAGTKLTIDAPWGNYDDDVTVYTYDRGFTPKDRSTLILSPGRGITQKTASIVLWEYYLTTIAVSNGTFAVDRTNGGKGYFGNNSVRVDDGGIILLEVQDATGYNITASPITINKGGTLAVRKRDTLRRPIVMNGGTITVEGSSSGRALDFYYNKTVTVTEDSVIQAIDDDNVHNPVIWLRSDSGEATTTFALTNGAHMVNNVSYASSGANSLTVLGTPNGNERFVMNGFTDNNGTKYPITYSTSTTIGGAQKAVTFELNAEYSGGGVMTIVDGSRLDGTGSVTGDGPVTFAAATSKVCGSLTLNNVAAPSGGSFGDAWNEVSAKVTGAFSAGGTVSIRNGSLTIGGDCSLLEDVVTSVTTNITNGGATTNYIDNIEQLSSLRNATLNIAADGRLILEKAASVAGLTVEEGGVLKISPNKGLTVSGTVNGNVNIEVDGYLPEMKLLEGTGASPDISGWTITDIEAGRRMVLKAEADEDGWVVRGVSKSGFMLILK